MAFWWSTSRRARRPRRRRAARQRLGVAAGAASCGPTATTATWACIRGSTSARRASCRSRPRATSTRASPSEVERGDGQALVRGGRIAGPARSPGRLRHARRTGSKATSAVRASWRAAAIWRCATIACSTSRAAARWSSCRPRPGACTSCASSWRRWTRRSPVTSCTAALRRGGCCLHCRARVVLGERFEAAVPDELPGWVATGSSFAPLAGFRSRLLGRGGVADSAERCGNVFRVVNEQGDGLPGVTIDRYGEYCVLSRRRPRKPSRKWAILPSTWSSRGRAAFT